MQDQELLESVCELAAATESCIEAALAELPPQAAAEVVYETLLACRGCIDMVIMAADTAQLTALKQLCEAVQTTLITMDSTTLANYSSVGTQLSEWSRAVQTYLRQPNYKGITPPLLSLVPIEQQETVFLALSGSEPEPQLESVSAIVPQSLPVTPSPDKGRAGMVSNQPPSIHTYQEESLAVTSAATAATPSAYELLFADLDAPLAALTTAITAEQIHQACDQYNAALKHLTTVIIGPGARGLEVICELLRENINQFPNLIPETRYQLILSLTGWPILAQQYLAEPTNSELHSALLTLVTDTSWPCPVTPAQTEDFLFAIKADTNKIDPPPPPVQPEDVALILDPGLNSKLIAAFFQEAPLNVADFTAALARLLHGENLSKNLSLARRLAHNLKGSANILGIRGLANLTHRIEDILDYLTEKEQVPAPALAVVLQEAADCLEDMMDTLQNNSQSPPAAARILQDLLTWTWRINTGQYNHYATSNIVPIIATIPEPIATQPQAVATPVSDVIAKVSSPIIPSATDASTTPVAAITPPTSAPEQKVLRVAIATIDYIFKAVSELSIATDQIRDHIQLLKSRNNELHLQNNLVQQRRFEMESFIDTRYITQKVAAPLIEEDNDNDDENRLNWNETHFDPLELRQYNELHTVTGDFIETVVDARRISQYLRSDLNKLEHLIAPMRHMQRDLQAKVMQMRMEPIATVSARLQRSVRHACRATGKEVELRIEGEATLIDSEVLDKLADPLMHILRNAVDHGIENPEQRVAKGKSATGNIHLRFYHEGQSIIVLCSDDGGGLDYASIRATGIARGFAVQNASNQELARLIMEPGFSTRINVTQISGRGVGMDVVQDAVRAMHGTVNISDAEGGGCQFVLRLPLTLITLHCLIIEIKSQQFAIPTSSIIRALSPGAGKFIAIGSQFGYEIGADTYSVVALAVRLNLAAQEIDELTIDKAVLLVQTDMGAIAVAIDRLLNLYNLVVKGLGYYIPAIRGIAGLATLADGTPLPILNLSELVNAKTYHAQRPLSNWAQDTRPTQQVLIVDDSLSVRQSLTNLMEEAGFQSSVARDGMEAVEMLQQGLPNVMLCDIEMPRMNGFELVQHIRTKYGPQLPIIMLTSRTSPKHRQQASQVGANVYFTKPFNKDELLITMANLLTA